MPSQKTRSRFMIRMSLLGLMLLSGCGGGGNSDTVDISGNVSLDGKPVPAGQIMMIDSTGASRTCAGQIENGNYSFASTLGKKRVEISWLKNVPAPKGAVGGIPGDPVSAENPATATQEMIPEKYNIHSELTADVSREGPRTFHFELKSK